jgi:hypothetical protein
MHDALIQEFQRGLVIPACPLVLNGQRHWDEARQRALLNYYLQAGAGALAVGVHTTQFAIRHPQHKLFEPVLALAAEVMQQADAARATPVLRVGGICGPTTQAVAEAALLQKHGYHAGLLSLGALREATDDELIAHCREIGRIIPLFGFYLQPAVGGRALSHAFWRRFAEIDSVVAIKVAAFNRYQTIDVTRALAESGRDDIALYTGNDDNIIADLVTLYRFRVQGRTVERRFVGGLLGQWAVWTRRAVEILDRCHRSRHDPTLLSELLALNAALTDANAVIFDAAHGFAGCIPGIHEVLRREGLMESAVCLDAHETLSPGQAEGIDRIYRDYPQLRDL